jgi:hypothetical protein
VLDEASLAALAEARALDHALPGTLAVTFAHGDPDVRRDVPSVPGPRPRALSAVRGPRRRRPSPPSRPERRPRRARRA